jgi:hypothetical protein
MEILYARIALGAAFLSASRPLIWLSNLLPEEFCIQS